MLEIWFPADKVENWMVVSRFDVFSDLLSILLLDNWKVTLMLTWGSCVHDTLKFLNFDTNIIRCIHIYIYFDIFMLCSEILLCNCKTNPNSERQDTVSEKNVIVWSNNKFHSLLLITGTCYGPLQERCVITCAHLTLVLNKKYM